jgi:hypothetical protein
MKGQVAAGTVGTNMFTLPAGYKPPFRLDIPVATSGGTSFITIFADGTFQATAGAGNTRVSLDGVTFDTEAVAAYTTGVLGPPRVTTLPPNAIDGQECYFVADATASILWHLRYNAAWVTNAYKWELVGGTALYDEWMPVDQYVGFGASTWGGISLNDPLVTVPLAGEYRVVHGAGFLINPVGHIHIGVSIGGVEPTVNVNSVGISPYAANVNGFAEQQRSVTAAAGNIIRQRIWQNAGSATVQRLSASLSAMPVRVG